MEMPVLLDKKKRLYYPWDPLQLDEEINTSRRVVKNSLLFKLFKAKGFAVKWSVIFDKNAGFSVDSFHDFEYVLDRMLNIKDRQQRQSVEIAFYDFTGQLGDTLLELDRKNFWFTYHPFDESFSFFLESLIHHRDIIRKKSKNSEAPNKLCQVIVPFVHEGLLDRLGDHDWENIISLLDDSEKERIYFFPVFEGHRNVPIFLYEHFSQFFFIGESGYHFVTKELLPSASVGWGFSYLEIAGALVNSRFKTITPLYTFEKTYSQWGKDLINYYEAREQAYRDFLESLD